MDVVRQLKIALKSGKLMFGKNQTAAACSHGEAK